MRHCVRQMILTVTACSFACGDDSGEARGDGSSESGETFGSSSGPSESSSASETSGSSLDTAVTDAGSNAASDSTSDVSSDGAGMEASSGPEGGSTGNGSDTSADAESQEGSDDGSESGGDDDATQGSAGEFPSAPAFGANVLDYDLVGVWGLSWQPAGGWDSVLEIDDGGEFTWTETSADCAATTFASGYLWVEGMQVVMHVETWERPLPWDTEPILGEAFPPPFRLRMSFTLQGGGADAYLAFSAPQRLTELGPYTGASYVRLDQQGIYLGGTWHGESELFAIPSGATEPVVVVRDVAEAFLDPESAPTDPQGTGVRAVTTTYFPIPQGDTTYAGANWTCLDGCPALAGTTLVDGSNLYTYGPYGGYEHLMTFADGRTFKRGVAGNCP
jgi:hypothetical protein